MRRTSEQQLFWRHTAASTASAPASPRRLWREPNARPLFNPHGPDGKALARNPGQVRFELLVDHGGTPTDPSDDEFLGLVKGSTGRTDDFCAAVVPVLEG
jgi:hypothetical protein